MFFATVFYHVGPTYLESLVARHHGLLHSTAQNSEKELRAAVLPGCFSTAPTVLSVGPSLWLDSFFGGCRGGVSRDVEGGFAVCVPPALSTNQSRSRWRTMDCLSCWFPPMLVVRYKPEMDSQ